MSYKDFNISAHFKNNYSVYFDSLLTEIPSQTIDETHMGDLARALFY